jgi:hypothetical protein
MLSSSFSIIFAEKIDFHDFTARGGSGVVGETQFSYLINSTFGKNDELSLPLLFLLGFDQYNVIVALIMGLKY